MKKTIMSIGPIMKVNINTREIRTAGNFLCVKEIGGNTYKNKEKAKT